MLLNTFSWCDNTAIQLLCYLCYLLHIPGVTIQMQLYFYATYHILLMWRGSYLAIMLFMLLSTFSWYDNTAIQLLCFLCYLPHSPDMTIQLRLSFCWCYFVPSPHVQMYCLCLFGCDVTVPFAAIMQKTKNYSPSSHALWAQGICPYYAFALSVLR